MKSQRPVETNQDT